MMPLSVVKNLFSLETFFGVVLFCAYIECGGRASHFLATTGVEICLTLLELKHRAQDSLFNSDGDCM